jgi:thiol-disulfide isomerase/thioredoxin
MAKIIDIQSYKKFHKKPLKKATMLFITIAIAIIAGLAIWHFFVEEVAIANTPIPPSTNVSYNHLMPVPVTASQVANDFNNFENKPILLYFYATWCGSCSKNMPLINDLIREFQNTELKVVILAIDRDLSAEHLSNYLSRFGEIYFQPKYLLDKTGFIDLLRKKNIKYNGRVPFTALISHNDEIIVKFSGYRSKNFLRNKIIKELYL